MKRLINSHQQRRGSRIIAAKALPLILVSIVLSGCETGANSFGNSLNWLSSSESATPETVVLARDPASLINGSEVEKTLYDAVELSRQKRFVEARQLLAEVRAIQDRRSEGYQALSTAMALIALREGDVQTFRRIARQLDESLGKPVRVDNAYVDVISLYRAMNNQALPVNSHQELQTLKEKYFPAQRAELNSEG